MFVDGIGYQKINTVMSNNPSLQTQHITPPPIKKRKKESKTKGHFFGFWVLGSRFLFLCVHTRMSPLVTQDQIPTDPVSNVSLYDVMYVRTQLHSSGEARYGRVKVSALDSTCNVERRWVGSCVVFCTTSFAKRKLLMDFWDFFGIRCFCFC